MVRELGRRGVDITQRSALEMFGGDGNLHTKDWARGVGNLEIWEFQPEHESALRRNFPQADVRIVDTYAEIRRTKRHYDVIFSDNPSST